MLEREFKLVNPFTRSQVDDGETEAGANVLASQDHAPCKLFLGSPTLISLTYV